MDRAGGTGSRASLARAGEDAALGVYRAGGFSLVARNWRCPVGEIDLVLRRGDLLVFCEVKTRTGSALGGGHEAVGWRKQRKLRQLADAFTASASLAGVGSIRFDVASVLAPRGRPPAVEIFRDAF